MTLEESRIGASVIGLSKQYLRTNQPKQGRQCAASSMVQRPKLCCIKVYARKLALIESQMKDELLRRRKGR